MNHTPDPTPLEPELIEALRSLGDVHAPVVLDDRVRLARLSEVEAPDVLWQRVSNEAFQPQVRAKVAPTGRMLVFSRRLASAAAVLLVFAGSFWLASFFGKPDGAALETARLQSRDWYASQVLAIEVAPSQLSPSARVLAGMMGAPLSQEQRS